MEAFFHVFFISGSMIEWKSYIHLRYEPNPMAREKLLWHKSYIHLQFEPNPMAREKLLWHKSYIRFRLRPNPMVHLTNIAQ